MGNNYVGMGAAVSNGRYDSTTESILNTSRAIVNRISEISMQVLTNELEELLECKDVNENIPNGVMLYIYVAAFLNFSARPINKENISNVVKSLGVEPNEKMIMVLVDNNMRSHLIYVYATYLLLAVGIMPEKESIKKVVEAIGESVDDKAAREAKYLIETIQNI